MFLLYNGIWLLVDNKAKKKKTVAFSAELCAYKLILLNYYYLIRTA